MLRIGTQSKCGIDRYGHNCISELAFYSKPLLMRCSFQKYQPDSSMSVMIKSEKNYQGTLTKDANLELREEVRVEY